MHLTYKVGQKRFEIGEPEIIALFLINSIAHMPASRYQILPRLFFEEHLVTAETATLALKELKGLKATFQMLSKESLIQTTAKGSRIAYQTNENATNLADYFLTKSRRSLIDTLEELFEEIRSSNNEFLILFSMKSMSE